MTDQRNDYQKNWQLLAEGHRQGLYNCFHEFYDDLYRFGIARYKDKELAREAIQELFLELWRIRDKLKDVGNMREYVLSIYKRILYRSWQQQQQHPLSGNDLPEEPAEQSYESVLMAMQEEAGTREKLHKVLDRLSPRQKEIIQLRFYEQMDIRDIAKKTSLTERTVYNTLYNALEVLREVMACILIPFFITRK
ncbi:MAG: sigma-70 family RNA polymerase sigma factor [Chitinophagaceae bacterium]|nr:sigma-70 family RNA polymerase sigma factor [Chitinophagaceae bacterium]